MECLGMTHHGDNQHTMSETPLLALDNMATTLRRRRMIIQCCMACALVLGLLAFIASIDMFAHMNKWIRMVLLFSALASFGTLVVVGVMRARRRSGDVVALALHLEQERQTLRGWLAAAIELRHERGHAAARCVQEASQRLVQTGPIRVTYHAPMLAAGTLLLIIITIAALFIAAPTTATTAARRVLLPLGSTHWPARTSVESTLPQDLIHGRGLPLRLEARNTTPQGAMEPVEAMLQATLDDGSVVDMRVLLTHHSGDLHGAIINIPYNAAQATVWFQTADARTPNQHIPILPLPAIKAAQVTVTPPWTHAFVIDPTTNQVFQSLPKLQRPVLHGSTVELTIEFDPLVQAPIRSGEQVESWVQTYLGWTMPYLPDIDGTASRWSVRWVVDADCRLQLHMEDNHGLQALNHPEFTLSSSSDTIPHMELLQPETDLSLPPTAIIDMHGSVVDDYPLHRLSLRVDPRIGAFNPSIESMAEPGNKASIKATVSMQSLGVSPGDILELRVEAEDLGDATTGHRVVQSRARTIQVVSIDHFLDNAHQELTSIGDRVRDMEQRQRVLSDQSRRGDWTHTSETTQTRLARDIRSTSIEASSVLDLLDMGQVDALDLRLLADEAVLVLGETANLAMTTGASENSRHDSQTAVQESLSTLADRLSGDRDQWTARRMVRDLLERQRGLQSTMADLDGLLSTARRRALDAAHKAQQALADDARETADTLQGTPLDAIGQALVDERVEADMQTAADEAMNDRIGLSRSAQARAAGALERINTQLNQATHLQRTETAVLQRRLSDLRSLVTRLLEHQRSALDDFNINVGDGMAQRLQRIHRGVLGAVQRAARARSETRGIESTLREAAALESSAILALLQTPMDAVTAHTDAHSVESHLVHVLDLISDASGDLARRDQRRMTTELIEKLQAIATQQLRVRELTQSHVDNVQFDRRIRFELRQLGVRQSTLVDDIRSLSDGDATIESSVMARAALDAAAGQASRAAAPLLDGTFSGRVINDQRQVEVQLQRLADAIASNTSESENASSPFSRAAGGDGGASGAGEGQQPQLPPVAELRILRGLQSDLLERTQAAIQIADESALKTLAQEQRALARLGSTLMAEVAAQHQPTVTKGDPQRSSDVQTPTIPMRIQVRQPEPAQQIQSSPVPKKPVDLPSLDTLLGLEETTPTQPMPPVPDDALAAVSARLMQAADALQDDADRLAGRLQVDVLARIDALLQQAEQQRQSGSAGESGGAAEDGQSQSEAPGAASGQPTGSSDANQPSGDGRSGVQEAVEPQLGGAMEYHGAAWGTLPPRLRAMLEQGRRDDTSMLYAEICAEYFRILLESPTP